ncbi:MAG TPA: AtpZ/AtpI family protein [Rhizorhapis sp.]
MMGGESGRDPNEEDSRLESLKERLRQADQDEAVRTGSTQKGVDQGYRLGNRVLAELVGGIAGGALIGWFFDWLFSTSPWLLLVFLFLGIIVAFRNIIRISNERPKE